MDSLLSLLPIRTPDAFLLRAKRLFPQQFGVLSGLSFYLNFSA